MKKLFPLFTLLLIATLITSCSADVKPYSNSGYSYCSYCNGTGYDYYYLGGIFSSECDACWGSGYAEDTYRNTSNSGSSYPSFRGGSQTGYTGPCKNCSCPGNGYRTANGTCSDCGCYWTDHVWHN